MITTMSINKLFSFLKGKKVESVASLLKPGRSDLHRLRERCSFHFKYYELLSDLQKNSEKYLEIYDQLEDFTSKQTLLYILHYRLTLNRNFVRECFSSLCMQYFDQELIKMTNKKHFYVDLGTYNGNTILNFRKVFPEFSAIYGYEPSRAPFEQALRNVRGIPNCKLFNIGVYSLNGTIGFRSEENGDSHICEKEGGERVHVVTLDEHLPFPATYIKMDLEGSELAALEGSKKQIKENCPLLAICVYHKIDDLWRIPLYLKSINDNYRFHLRHYHSNRPTETVLYAIPSRR